MSKVFVTQQSMVREADGSWRPRFDISPATEYGELHYIFGSGQIALMGEAVADAIVDRLDELGFDYREDYLLATGDMVLGMQAAHIMMEYGGCRILRWDGREKRYTVYNMEDITA